MIYGRGLFDCIATEKKVGDEKCENGRICTYALRKHLPTIPIPVDSGGH
jgi:hypothetical protein